jgi:hypothetical protein
MVATAFSAQPSNRESGQILILTAVTMIVLLGIAALSLDASFMYDKRNQLHAAADAAAKSAAIEVLRNPSVALSSLEAFADQQVAAHGFTPTRSSGTTSVVVNHGPSSGPFAGDVGYVEVIVSQPTGTFFARVLGTASMTPTASAVAGSANPQNCIIVLENFALGNSQLAMNGCGVSVGGNLAGTNPNAAISGTPLPAVGVTGTCSGTCGAMGSLTTGVAAPSDPLLGLAIPTNPGGCIAGVTATLSPGCYTSISSSVTTLQAGNYYVTGNVDIGSLTGTNVMLYLAPGGHLTSGNNKDLHLTAPSSGTYKGIAIFQDPSNANNFDTGNNFSLQVTGAIYMPGSDVDIANHLDFLGTTCTLFIAKSLVIRNGNGAMSNSGCAAAFGGAAYLSVSIAQ